jgi:hypothetical protein
MAGVADVTTVKIFVVDTSYLLELYRVDGCSNEDTHSRVKQKFLDNIETGQFFVPIAVLYELANHIADVHDALRRRSLADKLRVDILSSVSEQAPWVVTHATDAQGLDDLLAALNESAARFANEFSAQKLGLTDTTVILEAERLRSKFVSDSLRKYLIHIWTRHQELKAREPDFEESQFV